MDKEQFGMPQVEGFGDETESYQNLVRVITLSAGKIINNQSIPYDFNHLAEKMTDLKVIRRDGVAHEYDPNSNTLFISKFNQEKKQYSDEEMIIFTAHELVHLVSEPKGDDSFGARYFGFNEFFTEYLSFLVVSNIGGIYLESYFKHNVKGYFGNENDLNFIKKLSDTLGFKNLLSCYLNREIADIENLTGTDVLTAMNDYFAYCDQLSDSIGKPLREFNEIIKHPSFAPQKQIIDDYVNTINNYCQKN
jgi:hypothetical protein